MNALKITLFLSLFIEAAGTSLPAALVSYNVTAAEKSSFSFQQICLKQQHQADTPLMDLDASGKALDCMGTKVDLASFCRGESATELLRLKVEVSQKRLTCFYGRKVSLRYACAPKDVRCLDGNRTCHKLQNLLALDLPMSYHSPRIEIEGKFKEDNTNINCVYSSPFLEKELQLQSLNQYPVY